LKKYVHRARDVIEYSFARILIKKIKIEIHTDKNIEVEIPRTDIYTYRNKNNNNYMLKREGSYLITSKEKDYHS